VATVGWDREIVPFTGIKFVAGLSWLNLIPTLTVKQPPYITSF